MPDDPIPSATAQKAQQEQDARWVENRRLLDQLRDAPHPKLRALHDMLTGDDPPLTLAEAAQRVGCTRQWLRQLLDELRGE